MASELLKNRALIQKLKEPEVPVVKFNLGDTGFEELITLPEPKPQELLDIQEDVRIQRQQDTMDKARPFLMDESVDFIERENFAIKGLTDQQLLDLGFSKINLEPAKRSYQKLAEIFQQADIDDELEYLLEKSKNYPKGKIESTLRNVLQKLPEDEKGLKYIASLLGEDVEFVLDMIDDKKILAATGRDEKRLAKQLEKSERLRKEFGQVEKWMLKNASKYSDPEKFKKATVNRFGKKNAAIKAMTSGGGNFFSTEFNNNILGYKGTSDFAKINKSIGDNIFRTTIYNFNPNVRKAITNEFKSILSGGPAQVKAEARDRIKKSKLFKQFGLTEKIHGPISRLIYKEVGEELYKNLSAFRNPRVGTINLIQYLEGVVDPKYKSQFKEARIAMEAAGKNQFKKAKEKLGRTDKIMFDHKIPSSFIDAGYADPIEYIKVTPATENFNVKIKNKQYDVPVMKLLNKFEKATTPEAKQVIYNTILEKHNNFSKKYGGYLDNVKPKLADGKIQFSSSAAPITKKTKFVEEFVKAGLQTGQLSQAEANKLLGQKKLTAFEELKSRAGAGFDPILATKAGYQEFLKPAASIAKRGALTGLDFALSAGAGPIGLGVGALIETGQAMPELTRGNLKEAGRRTIIGSLLPESLVGSMRGDLLQLANTPEEKIAMQNFIDFEKDREKYESRVKNLRYLEENPFEAEGIDLSILQNKVLEQKADLEERAPKVFFKEFAQEILPTLVRRLDAQNVENLEGVLGSIVGRREIDDRDDILQDIGAQVVKGEEPFYGQAPVQVSPEELDEIYESGIMAMANGGRIGLADGPDDPSKRTFMKIMAGIASLPILGKFFKSANVAKKVVPLTNTTTTMPEWFPQFVEKALAKGVQTKVDADLMEVKIPELPDVKMEVRTDGKVFVEGKNAYNEPYQIEYEPPGYEVLDYETGKTVKTKGDFTASDTEYRMVGEDDYDVDGVVLDNVDEVLGGSATKLEGFAKGTGEEKYTIGQKRIDEAEALGERADENIPYKDMDPTDFADE